MNTENFLNTPKNTGKAVHRLPWRRRLAISVMTGALITLNGVAGATQPDALLAIDLNRVAVVERIVEPKSGS